MTIITQFHKGSKYYSKSGELHCLKGTQDKLKKHLVSPKITLIEFIISSQTCRKQLRKVLPRIQNQRLFTDERQTHTVTWLMATQNKSMRIWVTNSHAKLIEKSVQVGRQMKQRGTAALHREVPHLVKPQQKYGQMNGIFMRVTMFSVPAHNTECSESDLLEASPENPTQQPLIMNILHVNSSSATHILLWSTTRTHRGN